MGGCAGHRLSGPQFPMVSKVVTFWHRHPLVSQVLLVVAVVLVLMALGVFYPSTKLGFLLVIILAVVNSRVREFAIDFAPFIVLILTYNELRRFADNLSMTDINVTNLIHWEQSLFGGTLPSYFLQQHLWDQPYTALVDIAMNTFYLSHFITPVIAAWLLWRNRKTDYWAYVSGLVLLSYAAFATYVLFPAAPPWWATFHGYLPDQPVYLDHFIVTAETVNSGPNPVAAMPSLHVAYPTYIALVCITVWGRKAGFVFLLPVGVMTAAVYLGHHYVIDGLVGSVYALFMYSTVFTWLRRHEIALDLVGKLKGVFALGAHDS